ncbi:MAG: hypothetical protein ISR55_04090 [Bacteroidetes bacterium]|nr:hypothetical protein [Bacteroidota bacterium]
MKKTFKIVKIRVLNILLTILDILRDVVKFRKYNKKIIDVLKEVEGKKYIIIIANKFYPRVEKIVSGLIMLDFPVILLYKQGEITNQDNYTEIFQLNSPARFLNLSRKFKPLVFHIFSKWNFDIAELMIKKKIGKIVFDDYDVMSGFVNIEIARVHYPGQIKKERYCLENADGLCCRSLETQLCKRVLKYKFKGRRIFFPEYMMKEPDRLINEKIENKTIVYAGNYNESILLIAKEIRKIGWSMDVYPSYKISIKKPKGITNLRFFESLDHALLIKALKKYDVSLQIPNQISVATSKRYNENKRHYSMAAKIFDYMEAGLGVLIIDQVLQKWILNRYKRAVCIDDNGDILESLNSKLKNLNEHSEKRDEQEYSLLKLTIRYQIARLKDFYESINS